MIGKMKLRRELVAQAKVIEEMRKESVWNNKDDDRERTRKDYLRAKADWLVYELIDSVEAHCDKGDDLAKCWNYIHRRVDI
ncbi:hypothetical protein GCE9029_01184 [Grimontia celer]|uniref:Uncharacterized protein n=1 Tax=Grimontia celer TaxID=1796497 RepID=A0A128EWR2_9GAMM|nr:hypothetical protein GCE9029_01184 [Grimontia celer]